MLVSVIIPTWNRAGFVEKAVRSVLNQTMPDLEILVCDDGSTDGTREKVLAIKDSRVRWIEGQHGGRPAIPRNRGLKEAKGEWIAFLDSDDEWLPKKLAEQMAFAEKKELKAVCSNAQKLIPDQGIVDNYIVYTKETITFDDLLDDNKVICSSMMIHRSLLENIEGFPEEAEVATLEDYAFWLRTATLTDIAYIAEPLVIYRDDAANSVRSKMNLGVWEQKRNVINNFLRWAVKNGARMNFAIKANERFTGALLENFERELREVRNSRSFKLGGALLHPIKFLKGRLFRK